MVFVHKPPFTLDLFKSDCQPEVELDRALQFPVVVNAFHGGEAKSNVFAGSNMEVADLERPGASFEAGKEQLPRDTIGVDPYGLKGWRDVVHHDVLMMPCEDARPISFLRCLCPGLDTFPDLVLVCHNGVVYETKIARRSENGEVGMRRKEGCFATRPAMLDAARLRIHGRWLTHFPQPDNIMTQEWAGIGPYRASN